MKTGWIMFEGSDGKWWWKFIDEKGERLGQSTRGRDTRKEAEHDIRKLLELGTHLLGMQGIRRET